MMRKNNRESSHPCKALLILSLAFLMPACESISPRQPDSGGVSLVSIEEKSAAKKTKDTLDQIENLKSIQRTQELQRDITEGK